MYKIIAGSSCDLSEDIREEMDITLVPFKVRVGNKEFIDNENLDLDSMIDEMNKSEEGVKTACPGPGDFLEAFKGHKDIFVLTISSNLSGAYNSAVLARDMALEEDPSKFIYVFDTKSASAGESLVALKLKEEIDRGSSREEIVKNVEAYIDELDTFFILESLNNLIKNGRISKTQGLIAGLLNFKPIMKADGQGNIELFEKVRGSKKAFNHLVDSISDFSRDFKEKTLVITHVDAEKKANELKKNIEAKYNFKDIKVIATQGLCSAYADDGGIVIAY